MLLFFFVCFLGGRKTREPGSKTSRKTCRTNENQLKTRPRYSYVNLRIINFNYYYLILLVRNKSGISTRATLVRGYPTSSPVSSRYPTRRQEGSSKLLPRVFSAFKMAARRSPKQTACHVSSKILEVLIGLKWQRTL